MQLEGPKAVILEGLEVDGDGIGGAADYLALHQECLVGQDSQGGAIHPMDGQQLSLREVHTFHLETGRGRHRETLSHVSDSPSPQPVRTPMQQPQLAPGTANATPPMVPGTSSVAPPSSPRHSQGCTHNCAPAMGPTAPTSQPTGSPGTYGPLFSSQRLREQTDIKLQGQRHFKRPVGLIS